MTAVAAPYDDLWTADAPPIPARLEHLDEDALTALLTCRFRHFLARGHSYDEALLLSVGYAEGDLPLLAEATAGRALVHQ